MNEDSHVNFYSNMIENANIFLVWDSHKPAAMNGTVDTFTAMDTVKVDMDDVYSIKRGSMGNMLNIVSSSGTTAQYIDGIGGRTNFIGLI